jgi:Cys-rich protein (TIGR04453 family)
MPRVVPVSRALGAVVTLALALAVTALAACDRSPCEVTCRHVASCLREKSQGERLPGEHASEANPTCLERCAAATPEYASCEGKSRECGAVLACISYR